MVGVNSSYPGGFEGGVQIRDIPILNMYGGDMFWVDSGSGSDGYKGTFKKPFATLDYAVGQTTASNGDVIMVEQWYAGDELVERCIPLKAANVVEKVGVLLDGLCLGEAQVLLPLWHPLGRDLSVTDINTYK